MSSLGALSRCLGDFLGYDANDGPGMIEIMHLTLPPAEDTASTATCS